MKTVSARQVFALALILQLFAPSLIRVNAQANRFPFNDPKLPIDDRVNDLVSRMTLEEKVSQMMNAAAAIDRLGVPEYEWWNEALHGVARSGIATVFPQAIGLAATFDESLVEQVADVVSTEARAKHHEYVRRGERQRYKGLTFWSPNINIFRDPRWGRGQETWGEDPYLTGTLGSAYVRGLQGKDPKYLKVVSTVKHYAVHSGPEPERHSFDAVVSRRDMEETYLPAFRQTIVEAGAVGVMCAYNRTNGEPACSNKELADILFKKWQFKGHVVSDCAAIEDIWKGHKFVKTEGEASAIAVKHGTDLTCGREYRSLVQAVKDGLITEAEIDTAVKHLMKIRFRLGMFDPTEMVKYAQIPFSENDTDAHRALSLKAARESIVLLKNDSNALPLKKDLKNIAVIGPNADDKEVLLGNYNGEPSVTTTPLHGIRNKLPNATVTYSPGMYATGATFEPISGDAFPGGLKAEYYNNRDFTGTPALLRTDAQIDFVWNSLPPAKDVKEDGFAVRWTGKLKAVEGGTYQLGGRSNGPIKIWLDGKLVAEETTSRRTRNILNDFEFEAGRTYDFKAEYQELSNHYAQAKVVWAPPSSQTRLKNEALDNARKADAVVMVMGISPSIEGEEMPVQLDGFKGGDRTDISLPKPQHELIREIHATGKPMVLVLLGGSALAVNWESENVPAILQAWYPGPEGGTALADVLFGDYNPAGRLPVTFYRSVDQLPAFADYKMEGRTYRYFKGEPLFPFGHGLSYTTFSYANLAVKKSILAGASLNLSVDVTNNGRVAGDEVVQLYITDNSSTVPIPIRSLVGVTRVFLKPGEKRRVSFTLTPRQMSVVLDDGRRVVEPGDFSISVGGKQPGFKGRADAQSTSVVTGKFSVSGSQFVVPER
jgi:beta-glucosidase